MADSLAGIEICHLTTKSEFRQRMEDDVRYGMMLRPQRWIPSKYRYDDEGSVLFEKIVQQPEYYPARAEMEILEANAEDIVTRTKPDELIELGSGSSQKTRWLIQAMCMAQVDCKRYVPLDISEGAIREAAATLVTDYDWLKVEGMVLDFDHDLGRIRRNGRRLIAQFGTTISNYLSKPQCMAFVKKVGSIMTEGDAFLVGLDLMKQNVARMKTTYDDSAGAHATFKIRALEILNREFGSDFDKRKFRFQVGWNERKSAIETVLVADGQFTVTMPSLGLEITFEKGDEIVVGVSCKFTKEEFSRELVAAGMTVDTCYTDREGGYGIFLCKPSI